MPDHPASQDRPPLDDAQRRGLVEKAGYGSATTRPGGLTSPTRQTPPPVGAGSPFRQRALKDSSRPGLATARAGPLPTGMKAIDLGNRAYRSSSLTVTVTWP
jgi:hypothetical protein